MLIATAERTELLHLGVREWEPQHAEGVPAPEKEGCVLVWHEKPDTMPDAIVVADGGMQSFLAWTTTYAPHLTPITGLVEVVEHLRFGCPASRGHDESDDRPKQDATATGGHLGLVHAEVVAAYQGTFAPLSAGLTPYVSTFSWLALQQHSDSPADASFRRLRESWDEARRLLDAKRLGYDSEQVEQVWSLVTDRDLAGEAKENQVAKQVASFLDSVRAGIPSFDALDAARQHATELHALQTGPLESRVELFRKLAQSLYEKRNPPAGNAVVLGFALSLISQGSFAHVALLGPSRISDVRPLLWYGWFDFCRQAPAAATPAVAAASLQLRRASRVSSSAWRRQEVALDELRVLSRQKDPFADCLLDTRHPIRVGIAIRTVGLIQPGQLRGSDTGHSRHQQRSLFNDPT